jgi:hypothetical protein
VHSITELGIRHTEVSGWAICVPEQQLSFGAHPIARVGGWADAVGLISRYLDGESWDDPELQKQLSACLLDAQTRAAGPVKPMGPQRAAQLFDERAAAILREIRAEVSAD